MLSLYLTLLYFVFLPLLVNKASCLAYETGLCSFYAIVTWLFDSDSLAGSGHGSTVNDPFPA